MWWQKLQIKKKKINLDKPFISYKNKNLIDNHLSRLSKIEINNFFVNLNI